MSSQEIKARKCETCNRKKCPAECFNNHEGSIIALKKTMKEAGARGTIIDGQNMIKVRV